MRLKRNVYTGSKAFTVKKTPDHQQAFELDLCMAEEIIGIQEVFHRGVLDPYDRTAYLPHYSTNWDAAMDVVKKLDTLGWGLSLRYRQEANKWSWLVFFAHRDEECSCSYQCSAPTAPLGICLAAREIAKAGMLGPRSPEEGA